MNNLKVGDIIEQNILNMANPKTSSQSQVEKMIKIRKILQVVIKNIHSANDVQIVYLSKTENPILEYSIKIDKQDVKDLDTDIINNPVDNNFTTQYVLLNNIYTVQNDQNNITNKYGAISDQKIKEVRDKFAKMLN